MNEKNLKAALETALDALRIYADSSYFENSHYEAILDNGNGSGLLDAPMPARKVITFNYNPDIAKNAIKAIETAINSSPSNEEEKQ